MGPQTSEVTGELPAEIKLQPEYENEDQARTRIDRAIRDYNFRRPNSGEQFLSEIDAGHYVNYIVKNISGVRDPFSKTDDDSSNNLG